MKTRRRKKLDAKKAGRPYPKITIGYSDIRKLVSEIGKPNKWRIEYGDYFSFLWWVNRHDPGWPENKLPQYRHTLFGIPIFKREFLPSNAVRLVNEFTESSITIEIGD